MATMDSMTGWIPMKSSTDHCTAMTSLEKHGAMIGLAATDDSDVHVTPSTNRISTLKGYRHESC